MNHTEGAAKLIIQARDGRRKELIFGSLEEMKAYIAKMGEELGINFVMKEVRTLKEGGTFELWEEKKQ